mgnify:CR=1 FL=1
MPTNETIYGDVTISGTITVGNSVVQGQKVTLTDASPVTLTVGEKEYYELTAGTDRTVNASSGGVAGQRIYFVVRSDSALISRTITFGTNFLATGTITTPTLSTNRAIVSFISDGTSWLELSRQTAGV